MSCKTYKEIASELEPYLAKDEDLESAYKKAREAEYADLADAYVNEKVWTMDTINSALPYYRKQRVEIVDLKKNGDVWDIKYKFLTSDTVYSMKSGVYSPFSFGREGTTFEMATKDLDVLYSNQKFIFEGDRHYDERITSAINNVQEYYDLGVELADLSNETGARRELLLGKLETITRALDKNIEDVIVKVSTGAAETGGTAVFDGNVATVYVSVGPSQEGMSPLEAYVHEMTHVVTKLAIDSKDPLLSKFISNLEDVRTKVVEEVTVEQIMEYMENPNKQEAEDMLDYISHKRVGLHEFVAYVETNSVMRSVLEGIKLDKTKETYPDLAAKVAGILKDMLDNLLAFIAGTRGKNGLEISEAAIISLMNANRRAQEAKRNIVVGTVVDTFNRMDAKASAFIKSIDKKSENIVPKIDLDDRFIIGGAKMIKNLALAAVNKQYKQVFDLSARILGLKPEGTVMSVLRDMSESDNFQDNAEKLGLLSQQVDRQREFIARNISNVIRDSFSRKLTKEESDAVTSVIMDTDISALSGKYDFKELISDEMTLKNAIKETKSELRTLVGDSKKYNYYKNQADGLGYYTATGYSMSLAQMLNAKAIAEMRNVKRLGITTKPEIIKLIDELATLEAIKYTDTNSKEIVTNLVEQESNGISMTIAYQVAHKEAVENSLFKFETDKLKLIKGYSKDVYPSDMDFKIGTVEEEQTMKDLGYKMIKTLEAHDLDKSTPMAMYVSELNARQNLQRVAMRFTDKGRKGMSIGEKYSIDPDVSHRREKAKRDIANMKLQSIREAEAMMRNDYKSSKSNNLLPVLDNTGSVMDFRYVMGKQDKKELLKMDTRIDEVIGRTYASRFDKEESSKFNEEVIKLIEKDAKENYQEGRLFGKNLKEYVLIGKQSGNAEIRDIWSVLPDALKSKHKHGFYIRRDMMHSLLGYREMSVAEFPWVTALPASAKHGVRVAEKIWKDLVSIAKRNIVLKIPAVLIGNVTSNIAISVMSGFNPVKTAKLQLQGVRDLNRWIESNKKLLKLESLQAAGKGDSNTARLIEVTKNEIALNPATALTDEGFYTTILEELEIGDKVDSNIVTRTASKVIEKAPRVIRDGLKLVYLSEDTKIMKFMNAATQYSDFVARYAQYTMLVEKGIDKDAAAKEVRDAYVNYNKPNSRALEWANQMGFVMFTKYFTRIQKAIKYQFKEHPLTVLGAILAQEWVIGNIDDITDQSIIRKDIGNIFYTPMDTLGMALTPTWDDAYKSIRQMF